MLECRHPVSLASPTTWKEADRVQHAPEPVAEEGVVLGNHYSNLRHPCVSTARAEASPLQSFQSLRSRLNLGRARRESVRVHGCSTRPAPWCGRTVQHLHRSGSGTPCRCPGPGNLDRCGSVCVMVTLAQRGVRQCLTMLLDGLLNDSEHVNLRGFRNGRRRLEAMSIETFDARRLLPTLRTILLDRFRQPDLVELVRPQVVARLPSFRAFICSASDADLGELRSPRLDAGRSCSLWRVRVRLLDDRHVLTERIVHLVRNSSPLALLRIDQLAARTPAARVCFRRRRRTRRPCRGERDRREPESTASATNHQVRQNGGRTTMSTALAVACSTPRCGSRPSHRIDTVPVDMP